MQEGELVNKYLYKRENGEDITDLYATRNCKHEQNRDIIDNQRLGSYDSFGNYITTPEIQTELLEMPKIIIGTSKKDSEKIYDLRSYIPVFGDIYFKIAIRKKEVVLYLLETVNRELGSYVEVYEVLVEALAVPEGEKIPEKVIFKKFNVVTDDDDIDKIFDTPYNFTHILTRKVYMSLLSKELNDVVQVDEHEAFDEMIEILKNSGEYGERVLDEFSERLKDRPEIFKIQNTELYNKAVNEVLLSAVDMATTEEDKENFETKQIYFEVENVRNKNIENYIQTAHERVDEKYVVEFTQKTTELFNQKIMEGEQVANLEKENEYVLEFYDKFSQDKTVPKDMMPHKAVLKAHSVEEVSERQVNYPVINQGEEMVQERKTSLEESPQESVQKEEQQLEQKSKEDLQEEPKNKQVTADKVKAVITGAAIATAVKKGLEKDAKETAKETVSRLVKPATAQVKQATQTSQKSSAESQKVAQKPAPKIVSVVAEKSKNEEKKAVAPQSKKTEEKKSTPKEEKKQEVKVQEKKQETKAPEKKQEIKAQPKQNVVVKVEERKVDNKKLEPKVETQKVEVKKVESKKIEEANVESSTLEEKKTVKPDIIKNQEPLNKPLVEERQEFTQMQNPEKVNVSLESNNTNTINNSQNPVTQNTQQEVKKEQKQENKESILDKVVKAGITLTAAKEIKDYFEEKKNLFSPKVEPVNTVTQAPNEGVEVPYKVSAMVFDDEVLEKNNNATIRTVDDVKNKSKGESINKENNNVEVKSVDEKPNVEKSGTVDTQKPEIHLL